MSSQDKMSLLIRHGDRDKIPDGSFGNEILLNEKGKQNAQKFGESLTEKKVNKIYTSPILRCVQTAEFITKGYGSPIEIIETTALGAPGLHIADENIAGEFLTQHGLYEMYKRFVQGEKIPGIPNINELNHSITNFINEKSTQNGTTIFVTHDMLIAFYHYSINKTIYSKENWVNYLTGLTFRNNELARN